MAARAGALGLRAEGAGSPGRASTSRVVNTAVISSPAEASGAQQGVRDSTPGKGGGVYPEGVDAGEGPGGEVVEREEAGVQEGGGGPEPRKAAVREHPMMVMFREQMPMPFELAMLEAMLHEVRRAAPRSRHKGRESKGGRVAPIGEILGKPRRRNAMPWDRELPGPSCAVRLTANARKASRHHTPRHFAGGGRQTRPRAAGSSVHPLPSPPAVWCPAAATALPFPASSREQGSSRCLAS